MIVCILVDKSIKTIIGTFIINFHLTITTFFSSATSLINVIQLTSFKFSVYFIGKILEIRQLSFVYFDLR